jgi:hypothetical protein
MEKLPRIVSEKNYSNRTSKDLKKKKRRKDQPKLRRMFYLIHSFWIKTLI